jgi:hypothetical protein
MNTSLLRRAFQCAVLGVSLGTIIHPLAAQQPRLDPKAIGQIADEVFEALIPPNQQISRVPVSKRQVFFDLQRTLATFGYSDKVSAIPSDLGIQRAVQAGQKGLLEDCDQLGTGPCSKLGWGVYVWIEQVSVTTSNARVRAHVVWPGRGDTQFEESVAPKGRAFLVGFTTEVYLARSQDGNWKFVEQGETAAF